MYEYIINDFIIITLIIGFLLLLFNRLKVEDNKSKKIKKLLLFVSLLEVFNILEFHFSNLPYQNIERVICSFTCYSLRPLILITFISLLSDSKIIKYFYSISIINTLIYSTAFFSKLSFYFDETNKFQRGPLVYSVYIACIIYFLLLLYIIVKKHTNQQKNKTLMLTYISIISFIAALFDFTIDTNLFDQTILICTLIYYLFLNMEYNKIDPLTKLYNRQTFYDDLKYLKNKITSVVSVDMNGLKHINDTFGHLEGDKALVTISNFLLNSEKNKARFYRIGGDEFLILCFDTKEDEVIELIKNIKNNLKKTKYSCSFGYEMNNNSNDIFEIYKLADEKMYKEKENYYKRKVS